MEDWVTIRNLKNKNPEISNREVGRLLKISHNTVKKAIDSDKAPEYKRLESISSAISPYIEKIEELLIIKQLRGSRVLKELRLKGYTGSDSSFYRYISKLKSSEKRTYQPYETSPGEQAQFDWSPYTVLIANVLTKVYIFSYIHGYSRWRVYEVSLSQTLGSVFDALETSIMSSGGVCDRIQTDNAPCFVTNSSRDNLEWNRRYLQFCGHYRIQPTRSLPKHPWSKGKVERPFAYVEDHFIKGNEFSSFEDLQVRIKKFQEEVNERIHGTTREKPDDLFKQEQLCLGKLPDTRFVDIKEEVRKVTADCLIQFQGNRYSVPKLFATKEVWLKVSQGYLLKIYSSKNILIAEHKISTEKGKMIMKDEHYNQHTIERGNWSRLSQIFIRLLPQYEWFLDKLKTQKKINTNYHLTQILEAAKYFRTEDLEQAIGFCKKYNSYNFIFIKSYLENHCQVEELIPKPIDSNILSTIKNESIKRPLSEYKTIYYR